MYNVLRERVATQLAQVDGLDTKASALLGFTGVLLGLMFADSDLTSHWNLWMSAAVVLIVLSAAALAGSLWVRDWMVRPSSQDLRAWTDKPQAELERLLAAAFEAALTHHGGQAGRKAWWIRWGTSLFAAAILVAAVGLMVARSHLHAS